MCILPFWDYTKAIGFIIITIIYVIFIRTCWNSGVGVANSGDRALTTTTNAFTVESDILLVVRQANVDFHIYINRDTSVLELFHVVVFKKKRFSVLTQAIETARRNRL